MSEIFINSISQKQKCEFNNEGFCKHRDKCRKEHYSENCRKQNCDTKCEKKHPKPCRDKGRCKFNKRNVCALVHDNLDQDGQNKDDGSKAVLEEELFKMKENTKARP